jgi:antitoxin HicB
MGLGYTVVMRRDEEGDVVAEIQELPGCIAHGENPQEAWNNVRDVQKAWIEERIESGGLIPEPEPEGDLPSGKFVQRVPRTLHKRLAELAKKEGVSLNQLVTSMLSEALGTKSIAVAVSAHAHMDPSHHWLFAEWATQKEPYGEWNFGQSITGQGDILSALRNVKRIVPRLTNQSLADAETKEIENYFHSHPRR